MLQDQQGQVLHPVVAVQVSDRRSESVPRAVLADSDGRIFDHPDLQMVAWDGDNLVTPDPDELVQLPRGSDLFALPGRRALAIDPQDGDVVEVVEDPEFGPLTAVSAFLAPAWLRLLHPAYERLPGAPELSLYAYSAVGWMNGRFYVPAIRVDSDKRQDPYRFDVGAIEGGVSDLKELYPRNPLVGHLEHCALVYHCRAAQNYFLARWEAPLPTAARCNAACVGCISEQPDDNVEASHSRIRIPADPAAIAEVALGHLERVPNGVVSFGQGCEGEPLLMGPALEKAITRIRAATSRGVINLNTNGSLPKVVARLADAGLDAIRISLNSARRGCFERYYRPDGYTLDDLLQSAREMSGRGRFVCLNWLVFPGVSDSEADVEAMLRFIEHGGVDMIQLRNLNIDPEVYLGELGPQAIDEPMGMVAMVHTLRDRFPKLRFGYFNPAKTRFGRPGPLPGAHLKVDVSKRDEAAEAMAAN